MSQTSYTHTIAAPWLRQIEVILGPLFEENTEPSATNGSGKRIFADGTMNSMRVRFNVFKHACSTGRPSIIEIYNLSEKTRASIQVGFTQVILNIGYSNIPKMQTLFTGSLLSCFHRREGADIITQIGAVSGYGGLNNIVTMTSTIDANGIFSGMKISDLNGKEKSFEMIEDKDWQVTVFIKILADMIPNVKVDPAMISVSTTKLLTKGFVVQGTIEICLNELARMYGFTWGINNKEFYAFDDNAALQGEPAFISYENGYLIRVEPQLNGPLQGQTGLTVVAVLHPLLELGPGKRIQVKSSINKDLSSANNKLTNDPNSKLGYRATAITHSGDSHSSQWMSHIECDYLIGEQMK